MHRRDMMKGFGLGAAAGMLGFLRPMDDNAIAQTYSKATQGLPPLKIAGVKAILTAPEWIRPVRGEGRDERAGTVRPRLRHVQPAAAAVATAVDEYLAPLPAAGTPTTSRTSGRHAYTSSYWRNGPVLNNALSGLDQALWDIKGKRAGMPVYQLLGRQMPLRRRLLHPCRRPRPRQPSRTACGSDWQQGFRHIRIQLGGYGSRHRRRRPDFKDAGFGLPVDAPHAIRPVPDAPSAMFEHIRTQLRRRGRAAPRRPRAPPAHRGDQPCQGARALPTCSSSKIRWPPRTSAGSSILRQQCAHAHRHGRAVQQPARVVALISERLIDFIRVHVSQIGGLTPARKLAHTGASVSASAPPGTAPATFRPSATPPTSHLDLAMPQLRHPGERAASTTARRRSSPAARRSRTATCTSNEAPGFGVDIDEERPPSTRCPNAPATGTPSAAPTAPPSDHNRRTLRTSGCQAEAPG